MENKPKSKQSQIYFYIPLILSSFSYMCLNSLNYMIQIDSEYIIKINNNPSVNLSTGTIIANSFSGSGGALANLNAT